MSARYGLSLCSCGSDVFKIGVVTTRDYCMSYCVGGLVLNCTTLQEDEAPPTLFDDYEYLGGGVTCQGREVPEEPPQLAVGMEREVRASRMQSDELSCF